MKAEFAPFCSGWTEDASKSGNVRRGCSCLIKVSIHLVLLFPDNHALFYKKNQLFYLFGFLKASIQGDP